MYKTKDNFKYRSRGAIAYHVLVEAMHGPTLASISSHVRINMYLAQKYMSELIEKGLIVEKIGDGKYIYEITQEGRKFVELYRSIQEIFPI